MPPWLKDSGQRASVAGTTIILTTHYLEEAEMLCRNIGIIDKGRLIENTSMKSLLGKLGRETFLLDLVPGSSVPALPEFNGRMQDENTLEVELEKSQSLNSLFEQLSAQGVKVLSMRNKANRLEELFVNLVEEGRKA